MIRLVRSIGVCCAVVSLLQGCGDGLSPQAQRTVTTPLTAEQRAALDNRGPFLSSLQRDRLAEAEQKQALAALDLKVLGIPQTSAALGFGFAGRREVPFHVFRDGKAFVYPNGSTQVALDVGSTRIHEVFLAGASDQYIIGASNNGTQMSWNADRTASQLVLRPQQSTFGRVRAYDFAATRNSSHLIQAVEGQGLERWSLVSGNRTTLTRIEDGQPRALLNDSHSSRVVFGTQDGAVREWHNSHSHELYRHQGPVLELAADPRLRYIVSASKDGTVLIYERSSRTIVHQMTFRSAVYSIKTACDGRYVIAQPSVGHPVVYDTVRKLQRDYRAYSDKLVEEISVLCGREELLILSGDGVLSRWDLRLGLQRDPIKPFVGGRIRTIALHERSHRLALVTNLNRIEIWNLNDLSYITAPLQADPTIYRIKFPASGRRLLALLDEGHMLNMLVPTGRGLMYRFGSDD